MKQKMMGWQWHQLDQMQIIYILLQTDNHASNSSLNGTRFDSDKCQRWLDKYEIDYNLYVRRLMAHSEGYKSNTSVIARWNLPVWCCQRLTGRVNSNVNHRFTVVTEWLPWLQQIWHRIWTLSHTKQRRVEQTGINQITYTGSLQEYFTKKPHKIPPQHRHSVQKCYFQHNYIYIIYTHKQQFTICTVCINWHKTSASVKDLCTSLHGITGPQDWSSQNLGNVNWSDP